MGCETFDPIKAPQHAHHGSYMSLPPISRAWQEVTICLVTDLSESTARGCTGFIVVVNRSKRIEPYIRGRQDIDSGELAPVC